MRRLAALLVAVLLVVLGACARRQSKVDHPERLYFAVEMRHEGRLLGKPKLLGETGKAIHVVKRGQVGLRDYELRLRPSLEPDSGAFRVEMEVATPRASGQFELALLHGEERKLRLEDELEVRLMLMRVDSPEFRALMDLSAAPRLDGAI